MNGLFDPRREHDACGVGFVAYLDGQSRHDVMHMALGAMTRMAHRGGGDGRNGDGAGILFPLPRDFFLRQWPALSVCAAPWAVAQLFLPRDAALRALCLQRFREIFTACGLRVEDERDVPVREDVLAPAARQTMPGFLQLLVLPDTSSPEAAELHDPEALERRLFLARHMAENLIWKELRRQGQDTRLFYVASCSCRSIVYKGMLPGSRLGEFYTDLTDEDCAAPFAVFHERFSTNTLPSWPLAQPFRLAAHNGEINTLRGNAAHMGVREAVLASPLLGAHLKDALPVINPDTSDSGTLDNVLELLVRAGYTLPHALMMMVPEPFGPTFVMGDNKRAFYEYHSSLMEPWDGPTCLVFTDGWRRVGAMLDRNGLRPCRWSVSRDGLMVLGSESGLVDVPEEDIIQRGQLQPRRMILADVEHHRIAPDAEIKGQVIRSQPWRRWLQKHAVRLETLNGMGEECDAAHALPPLDRRLRQAGCDSTWQRQVLVPMAENAQEPVCSMGTDKPLPCLSDEPQSLFRWFKQRFAQVTNPPIDPYREQLSMSLMGHAGRAGNILEPGPESCAVLRLPHPFLTTDDMRRIRASRRPAVRAATLDATFPAHGDGEALRAALDRLFADAEAAIAQGATILVVSDTAMTADKAPIPALLACAGLHHHLIRAGLRHACGIIAESGEACEVIHMAQLIGYGVNAVCPHAALDAVRRMAREGRLSTDAGPLDEEDAQERYINALKKGLLKAFARLGISTLRSFRGSQPFEALGLSQDVIDRYFTGTPCSINGIGLETLARDAALRHAQAWDDADTTAAAPAARLWSPRTVRALHTAVNEDTDGQAPSPAWQTFSSLCNEQEARASRCAPCWRSRPTRPAPPSLWTMLSRKRPSCGTSSVRPSPMAPSVTKPTAPWPKAAMPAACPPTAVKAARIRPATRPGWTRTAVVMTRAPASARSLRAALASRRNILPMRKRSRSRRPRVPSPVKAASCPPTRSRWTSPASAPPCPGSPWSPRRRITTSTPSRIWRSSSTTSVTSILRPASPSSWWPKAVSGPSRWVWPRPVRTAWSSPAMTAAPVPAPIPPSTMWACRGNPVWPRRIRRW